MAFSLPIEFENKMKELLKEDFEAFLNGFESDSLSGVRFNRLKTDASGFTGAVPFSIDRIPWIDNGYYYPDDERPAKHPYYYAGLYYIQEPSAMTPANVLPVEPGDKVLDICAAPGGKSTELAAKLNGTGVLFSNDISNSRAKALLKNLELFGAGNIVVMSEAPGKLTERFRGYFDKILIDAPCSGEGMFRKSPAIMKNWEQYGTEYYNKLQLEIVSQVVPMLKPGGMMVYSTCTFDKDEDEGTLEYILNAFRDMHVIAPELKYDGFDHGHPEFIGSSHEEIKNAIRIWPHKMKGEGHFIALLKKDESSEECPVMFDHKNCKVPPEAKEFLDTLKCPIAYDRLELKDNRLYMLPPEIPDLSGLRIMRKGLLLGELEKNRFEPSQALAMYLKQEDYPNTCSFKADSPEVIKYLKCETVECDDVKDGFVLVCADSYPLGWAKSKNGILKNRYLPGWRMM